MNENEVRDRAFAMPLTSPAFPKGPYRFINREFFIVTYRTDPEALKAVIPAPLEMTDPVVKFEFIRMPELDRFRRFYGKRAGHTGPIQGPGGRLFTCDVSQRSSAHRRRP